MMEDSSQLGRRRWRIRRQREISTVAMAAQILRFASFNKAGHVSFGFNITCSTSRYNQSNTSANIGYLLDPILPSFDPASAGQLTVIVGSGYLIELG